MEELTDLDTCASKQPRGRTWTEDEVLALLDIWTELKLQTKLKSNHRNLGIFKEVSKEMAKRKHQRSAVECRSKSKKLRFEYRKVVKHNKMSGRQPVTCPYYKELDNIFHGDVSITPHRLSRSIDMERSVEVGPSNNSNQLHQDIPGLDNEVVMPSNSHEESEEGVLLSYLTLCHDVLFKTMTFFVASLLIFVSLVNFAHRF